MSKCDKLLDKAKRAPNSFSFTEICQLAECFGFVFQRQSASHVIYEHPNLSVEQNRFMNFQNFKGKAKPYQVKQLLKAISILTDEG
jgi:hypothetical protein